MESKSANVPRVYSIGWWQAEQLREETKDPDSNWGKQTDELTEEQRAVLNKLSYEEIGDILVADASLRTKPSSLHLGNGFRISNGVKGISFKLSDGTDAIGLVNRYVSDGSVSNPRFYALESRRPLVVNDDGSEVLPETLEINYNTVGDNLTYDFDLLPSSSGTLRAEYWLGDVKIFDEVRTVTDAEVLRGLPIRFGVGNHYLLTSGSALTVRFSGVHLRGLNGIPYFVSYIHPYKEIQIGSHVESTSVDICPIYIGCSYAVDTSTNVVTLTVPEGFKDTFDVFDAKGTFRTRPCFVELGGDTYELNKNFRWYHFWLANGTWQWSETRRRVG